MKKFISGIGHIFNPVPTNDEEVVAHGNAMAANGNYPVGTDGCFNVGISGGCGPKCFIYLRGDCEEPQEMVERLDSAGLELHNSIYT